MDTPLVVYTWSAACIGRPQARATLGSRGLCTPPPAHTPKTPPCLHTLSPSTCAHPDPNSFKKSTSQMGAPEYLHLKEPRAEYDSPMSPPLCNPPCGPFSSLDAHFTHTHTQMHSPQVFRNTPKYTHPEQSTCVFTALKGHIIERPLFIHMPMYLPLQG